MKQGRTSIVARVGLQFYRAGVVFLIALMVHNQYIRLQIDGELPLALGEVQQFLKNAAALKSDLVSTRTGMEVFDSKRERIGYALHTLPECKTIKGYAGPTDTLVVFDAKWVVCGVAIRRSADTVTHVHDVAHDPYFLKSWEGKSWEELSKMDLKRSGVEGVSGASLTSMALARGILHRVRQAELAAAVPPPFEWPGRVDWALFAALVFALVLAFTRLRGIGWLRVVWQIILVGGVGLLGGQLLALALAGGWTASGVAWRAAPAMALIAAVSVLVPWSSKKALYCQYFCPHGAAQELLHRVLPKNFRVRVHPSFAAGVRWTPALLLLMALGILMLGLAREFDLANLEPFHAYLLKKSGWVPIWIAIAGLVASLFVPMAYCKFGCPTGAILEFIRARGPGDKFGRADWMGLFLLLSSAWIYFDYERFRAWIDGV